MQKIITEKIGDKVIVLLQGDVDAADRRLTRRFSSPQQKDWQHQIWVDCSSVACIHTHGLCHFINQLLLLRRQSPHITLLSLDKHCSHLLSLLKVEDLFTLVPDFEEAYRQVQTV